MTLTPEQRARLERMRHDLLSPANREAVDALLTAHDALAAENRALREALEEASRILYTTTGLDAMRANGVVRKALTATRPPEAPEVLSCVRCQRPIERTKDGWTRYVLCATCEGSTGIPSPTAPHPAAVHDDMRLCRDAECEGEARPPEAPEGGAVYRDMSEWLNPDTGPRGEAPKGGPR